MKILIDVPKDYYEHLIGKPIMRNRAEAYIVNGTVLPDVLSKPNGTVYSIELYSGCLECKAHDRCMDAFLSTAINCNNYGVKENKE